MTAPNEIGLICDGLGFFALAHKNEADIAIRYIRADLVAARDAEIARLQALVGECEKYLKDGETPRQRMDRDHADVLGLMKLIELEKRENERLQAQIDACPDREFMNQLASDLMDFGHIMLARIVSETANRMEAANAK